MNTLDEVTLPDDIWWEDEIDWTPVEQTVEYSTTGALLIDLATKQAGRPITLVGDEKTAWITRATALALQALAAVPGKQMDLALHGQQFTVMFRHEEKKALDTEPLVRITPPDDGDYYILKALKLMAV
ncbi:MAG: hypothetical protein VR65_06245 [Desulfobulbaceae bacterium BRH_c16a]|nr:MAG: hypothetical protein VR65_06245 [Desulfobulbaceae bacterium BRH_c16a]